MICSEICSEVFQIEIPRTHPIVTLSFFAHHRLEIANNYRLTFLLNLIPKDLRNYIEHFLHGKYSPLSVLKEENGQHMGKLQGTVLDISSGISS